MEQKQEATTQPSARSAKRKQPPPTVQRHYTAVIELVRAAQKHAVKADDYLWQIGDALIEACGAPGPVGVNDQSGIKMSECDKELKQEDLGQEYSLAFLKKLRMTSADFSEENRLSSVSWAVHNLAGDRATLDEMLKKAKTDEKRLTTTFAKDFKQQRKLAEEVKKKKHNQDDPDSALRNCVEKAIDAQTSASNLIDLAKDAEKLIPSQLSKPKRENLSTAIKKARDDVAKAVKAWDELLQKVAGAA